ncbi:MAG: hypothetical protein MK052_10990 [Alphaproteobacteria bacterium]|nr:hypothetical protein [Alphaproteobacteria bacterium]
MTELSRSEQIIAEKTVCMLLVRGEDPDGGGIYAYVAVRADKLEEFMKAQEEGLFYPDDYGVIVEAGEGEPNEEVQKRMEEEYGFNHQAMLDIPASVSQDEINQNMQKIREQQEKEASELGVELVDEPHNNE